jgi:hypothetical protein
MADRDAYDPDGGGAAAIVAGLLVVVAVVVGVFFYVGIDNAHAHRIDLDVKPSAASSK